MSTARALAPFSSPIAAVSTGGGSWNPFRMTRAMIGGLDPIPIIMLKLDDHYEPLMRSPPLTLLRHLSTQIRGWAQRGGDNATSIEAELACWRESGPIAWR
jgi:hypothetical protein